jgi:hypothetical protein
MAPLDYVAQAERDRHYEYMKSKVRREVEHVFAVIKGKFGYRKAVPGIEDKPDPAVYAVLRRESAALELVSCLTAGCVPQI